MGGLVARGVLESFAHLPVFAWSLMQESIRWYRSDGGGGEQGKAVAGWRELGREEGEG
jgi:hypothetical protein